MAPTVNVPYSVLREPEKIDFVPGTTLGTILDLVEVPDELRDRLIPVLNGKIVRERSVALRDSDSLSIALLPAGDNGRSILAAVAIVAIAVAAPYLAAGTLGFAMTGAGVAAASAAHGFAFAAIQTGISLLGTMMISALIPPPKISSSAGSLGGNSVIERESRTYSLSGQSNNANPYGVVPRVYGTYRMYPLTISTPLVENVGKTSQISALYDFGLGNLTVSDIRIGETIATELGARMRVLQNTKNPSLKYVTNSVTYEEFAYVLEKNTALTVRTAQDATKATLDIAFPGGLVRIDNGSRESHSVAFKIRYKQANGGSWTTVSAADVFGVNATNSSKPTYEVEFERPDYYWYVKPYVTDAGNARETVQIVRNGAVIYSYLAKGGDSTKTAYTVNGRQYRRGGLRETEQDDRGDTMQFYEILSPVTTSGNGITMTASTNEQFIASVQIEFKAADVYDIEITRLSDVAPDNNVTLYDESVLTLLKSFREGDILNLERNHTMMEMTALATDRLSGNISTISAECTSILRTVTSSGWSNYVETGNNALVALDILLNSSGPTPITNSQIDFASWNRLQNRCNESVTTVVNGIRYRQKRFTFNGVIDVEQTTRDAIASVLAPAGAALTITPNGKYGVIIDEEQDVPRQLITPANSWSFSGQRGFPPIPHALRVQFNDSTRNYEVAEVVVYNDGYSASNATVFESLRTVGMTTVADAWRYGRYMIAQGVVRSEIFTVSMDVENLAVQRGDLVAVQHDVPMQGGLSARIIEISGKNITLDRPFELPGQSGLVGGYTVRLNNGKVRSGRITSAGPTSGALDVDNTSDMAVGNLIAIGSQTVVTRDYIVLGVEPGEDLTAVVSLVKYDERIYRAAEGNIPPWDPGFGPDLVSGTSLKAKEVKLTQSWEYDARYPVAVINVSWKLDGTISSYLNSRVDIRVGKGQYESFVTSDDGRLNAVVRIPYEQRVYWTDTLNFKVTPYNSLGVEGQPATASMKLDLYDVKPEPPQNCFLDVRGSEITIYWQYSPSPDVIRYVLRYTPEQKAPTWKGAQQLATLTYNTNEVSVGARTGTYMLRAQTMTGQFSSIVYLQTTIEELPDINVVKNTNGAPNWNGQKVNFTKGREATYLPVFTLDGVAVQVTNFTDEATWNVVKLDGSIVDVTESGTIPNTYLVTAKDWADSDSPAYYYDQALIDLGAIYETTINNFSQSALFSDQELVDYSQTGLILTSDEAEDLDWKVDLEYQVIDQISVIHDWPKLSEIETMSMGTSEWTGWRKVLVGYATGRMFKFRFNADAADRRKKIVMFDGAIQLDMPDRTWRKNNVEVPSAGVTINFDPAFKAKPVMAITTQGAVSYEITNINRISFDLRLKNASGSYVSGSADIAALGYGRERDTVQ